MHCITLRLRMVRMSEWLCALAVFVWLLASLRIVVSQSMVEMIVWFIVAMLANYYFITNI